MSSIFPLYSIGHFINQPGNPTKFEVLRFERMDEPAVDDVHRHTFYEIIWVDAGQSRQTIDKTTMMQEQTRWVFEPSQYKMTGDLTRLGITKLIELDVELRSVVPKDPFGKTKVGLKVTGSINRKDWGMVWNNVMDFGGLAVGEHVRITCHIELEKQ